ncbi:DUF2871 domain-containing protein [Yinghuangia seranimata]|uniref:DUF2871 domain-containing protein n=1 Tax=Yinghuangia seranimata TaxID=408067 RepID=UPI00248C0C2A|nr:DUF2871 domain-containing protein [Yinghuangia seranimata]MDI2130413.1 DUF2871 domain-containing protein [Yinghuangia seranimata]
MRKSYVAAHVYMIVGVVSGLYYREFTKHHDYEGDTQLALMHTHLLALGMLGFLIILGLDKAFDLSGSRLFTWFFWFYNAGIAVTVGMMFVHGTQQVLGKHTPTAVSLTAGLGHILLTVGLILLFVLLGNRLKDHERPAAEPLLAATNDPARQD